MSELEYGLIIAHNAFNRWMSRCMAAAVDASEFSPLDVLVIHNLYSKEKPKRLVDICFMLNIEDQHTVNYSLKKLLKADLISSEKRGKEMFYKTTDTGQRICDEYREIREKCLISSLKIMDTRPDELSRAAAILRSISGIYDQASRSATSL